jgi:hypothetical protein
VAHRSQTPACAVSPAALSPPGPSSCPAHTPSKHVPEYTQAAHTPSKHVPEYTQAAHTPSKHVPEYTQAAHTPSKHVPEYTQAAHTPSKHVPEYTQTASSHTPCLSTPTGHAHPQPLIHRSSASTGTTCSISCTTYCNAAVHRFVNTTVHCSTYFGYCTAYYSLHRSLLTVRTLQYLLQFLLLTTPPAFPRSVATSHACPSTIHVGPPLTPITMHRGEDQGQNGQRARSDAVPPPLISTSSATPPIPYSTHYPTYVNPQPNVQTWPHPGNKQA